MFLYRTPSSEDSHPTQSEDRTPDPTHSLDTSRHTMLHHVPCALCGADNFAVVYPPRYDRERDADLAAKFRASGDELLINQLVRCLVCDFQYVNPRLPADLIAEGYTQGDDPAYVSQMQARERTFVRSLDDIERAVDTKGRLLDVGTAAGAFVAAARDRGWKAEGCEPNHWLADWGAQALWRVRAKRRPPATGLRGTEL